MSKERKLGNAAGVAEDIFQKLYHAVIARGGCDDDIRRVSSDDALCGRLADQIMGVGATVTGLVTSLVTGLVTVDTSLGLEGLLAACELDVPNEKYILYPEWNPPPVPNRGRYQVEVECIELGRDMTTAEIETMLNAKGYRPALPEETLAGCAKDKDRQRKNPVVCFGAFWVSPDGRRHALVLHVNAGKRWASLRWGFPGHRWNAHCLVAAVRK
jgi:hypothetical protein